MLFLLERTKERKHSALSCRRSAQSLGKFRGAREEGDAEGLRLFDERGGVRIHIEQIFEIRSVPVLADKAGDFALFAEKTGFVRGKEEISAPFFVAEKPEYLSAFQGGCGEKYSLL